MFNRLFIVCLTALIGGCAAAPSDSHLASSGSHAAVDPAAAAQASTASALRDLSARMTSGEAPQNPLFLSQEDRRLAFAHTEKFMPARVVKTADHAYPLTPAPADFSALRYEVDGQRFSVADFLAMPSAMGYMVVKDDQVLLEHYADGNDADSIWVSFSVTKSVTSMLIGAAIQEGYIQSVDDTVDMYLPRLRGTPYGAARIEDILHMASGMAWNEDYEDPKSDVAIAGAYNGVPLTNYFAQLPREHTAGEVFNYNTGEANLAGELLRAAIGNNAATFLSQQIWQPFGMSRDATWLIDMPGGGEAGGCCISATLGDYARLGLFAMHDGVLPNGKRVLPEGWMSASTTPFEGRDDYGYMWWLSDDGSYRAGGIFAQMIFVDPANNLVISAHGNAPTAVNSAYHKHLAAVTGVLSQHIAKQSQ